jgi:cytochrome c-type biogenesis protein CcmH
MAMLVMTLTALALDPDEKLADPALEARARALSQELRCVVCQNQSIDDSSAPVAKDLRRLVRAQLLDGKSDQQVLDHVVARYGTFVLLRPPVTWSTLLLWLAPAALILATGLVLWRRADRRRGEAPVEPLSAREAAALERVLRETR